MGTKRIYVSGDSCFMRHPTGIKTHWIKTDRCVAFVACESCGVKRGELCLGREGPISTTHFIRRRTYTAQKATLDPSQGTTLNITVEG